MFHALETPASQLWLSNPAGDGLPSSGTGEVLQEKCSVSVGLNQTQLPRHRPWGRASTGPPGASPPCWDHSGGLCGDAGPPAPPGPSPPQPGCTPREQAWKEDPADRLLLLPLFLSPSERALMWREDSYRMREVQVSPVMSPQRRLGRGGRGWAPGKTPGHACLSQEHRHRGAGRLGWPGSGAHGRAGGEDGRADPSSSEGDGHQGQPRPLPADPHVCDGDNRVKQRKPRGSTMVCFLKMSLGAPRGLCR